jgi:hypothetical protein
MYVPSTTTKVNYIVLIQKPLYIGTKPYIKMHFVDNKLCGRTTEPLVLSLERTNILLISFVIILII